VSLIIDALQPYISSGVLGTCGAANVSIDDLLGPKGAFTPSFESVTSSWDLDFREPSKIAAVMASECARHGSATFQSFYDVEHSLASCDHLPWGLIRAYYSAYYAAHAILRALGSSCNYIDAKRASRVRGVASIYGIANAFDGGLYTVTVMGAGTILRFRKIGSSMGGTHDAFWDVFQARLKELEPNILSGALTQADAQRVFVVLNTFRSTLAGQIGASSGLSQIRNAVQYRHSIGTWFPLTMTRKDQRTLEKLARQWLGNPLKIDLDTVPCGELGRFVNACTFLVSVCRALLVRIGERCPAGRSFVHFGPLKFLDARKLKSVS
jgi:hypothetical protein